MESADWQTQRHPTTRWTDYVVKGTDSRWTNCRTMSDNGRPTSDDDDDKHLYTRGTKDYKSNSEL